MYQWSAKRTNKSSCYHPVQTSWCSLDLGTTVLSNFCCLQLAEPGAEDGCLESKNAYYSHPQWHSSFNEEFILASNERHQWGSPQIKTSRENSYAANASSLLNECSELNHAESKNYQSMRPTLNRTKIAEDCRKVLPKCATLDYANAREGGLSIPNFLKNLPASCRKQGIILTSGEVMYLEAKDSNAELVVGNDRSADMPPQSLRRKMVLASTPPTGVMVSSKPTAYLSCPATEGVLQLPVPLPIYYAFFSACQKFITLTQRKQGGQAIFSSYHPAWHQRYSSSSGNQEELYCPEVFLGSYSTRPGLSFHWVNNDTGTCAVLGMHIDSILAVIQDFRYLPSIISYKENTFLPYQQSLARSSCSDTLYHNTLTRKDTSNAAQHNENCYLVSEQCPKYLPNAFLKQQSWISTPDSGRRLHCRISGGIATECCFRDDFPAQFMSVGRGSENSTVKLCSDYVPTYSIENVKEKWTVNISRDIEETGHDIKFSVPSAMGGVFYFTNSIPLLEIPVELAQADKSEDIHDYVEEARSSCIDEQGSPCCSGEHSVCPDGSSLQFDGLGLADTELAPAERAIIQKLKKLSHLLFDVYSEIRKAPPVSKKALPLPGHVLNEHKKLHSSTSSLEACPLAQVSKKKDGKKCRKRN